MVELNPLRHFTLGADRWSFIVPTRDGLATPKKHLIRDGVVVVCEGAIQWLKTKSNHADVWATLEVPEGVAKFPPGLSVWGPNAAWPVWKAAGIPFHPLPAGGQAAVVGPGGVPRPADAFFLALEQACASLHAREVRVHGAWGWKGTSAWKRVALSRILTQAQKAGIDLQVA